MFPAPAALPHRRVLRRQLQSTIEQARGSPRETPQGSCTAEHAEIAEKGMEKKLADVIAKRMIQTKRP